MPPKSPPSAKALEAIVPPQLPSGPEAKEGEIAFDHESRQYDTDARRIANEHSALRNQELSDTLAQRKKYAKDTFKLVAVWMTIVLTLVLLQGLGLFHNHLSDNVLAVTVGTTTVNVLGMLAIILHGLYPSSKD